MKILLQRLPEKQQAKYLKQRRCQAWKTVTHERTGELHMKECDLITDKGHALCPLHELERGPVDAVANASVESAPSGANTTNGGEE